MNTNQTFPALDKEKNQYTTEKENTDNVKRSQPQMVILKKNYSLKCEHLMNSCPKFNFE